MRPGGYSVTALPNPDDVFSRARGLDVDGLLALLESLDGEIEAGVVRSALAAGVPQALALEELQREVERRLIRAHGFYDQGEW